MKRIVFITGAIVILALIAWGAWFFISSNNQRSGTASGQNASLPSVQSKTSGGTSVSVRSISSPQNPDVAKDFLSGIQNSDQIALGGTVVASPYALQIWGDANMGGEALLKYASSGWTLVSLGGGEWSALALMQEGVPQVLAEQLIAGVTGESASSSSPAPTNIPAGDTITIGTPTGGVVMNNFYKNADYIAQAQHAVVIKQTSAYDIVYNIQNSNFSINIFSAPPATARQDAEAAFLSLLGIGKSDACRLNVYIITVGQVNSSKLSFCTWQ